MTTLTSATTNVAVKEAGSGRKFDIVPYLFILPQLIFFIIFAAYPFFFGIYVSLYQYDFLRPEAAQFVGLGNYYRLFFEPTTEQYQSFWNAVTNTGQFVLMSVPPLVVIPLFLAVLLNTKTPGRNIFRAIYFAPWVLSGAVVGLLGFWIFQSQGGLVNYYLEALGVENTPRWLASMPWAWYSILIITVWWTMGFNMIILLAALQDIAPELYEAASIDGANAIDRFVRITLPLLRPVLVFVITITIIASFNLFIQPMFMTNAGPAQAGGGGATEPIVFRLYTEGFVRSRQGSAAAMSTIVAAIMMLLSYSNFRLFRVRE